jgi:hypothetical protein
LTTLGSMLSRGYFPRELPPAFQTETFSNVVVSNQTNLPPSLAPGSTDSAELLGHSVARLRLSRRLMSVPNPVPYVALCREVEANWAVFQAHCQRSVISRSIPIVNPGPGRELVTVSDFPDLLNHRSRIRCTSRYILKADIAKFFPSLYSHSLPWALHGKVYAKANRRDPRLHGNVLDRCVRNCQDQQTVGVPIGPDTSLLLSEIVLCAVDVLLQDRLARLNCFRHVDDFEFGVESYSQAEHILGVLQEALKEYELDLNFVKTEILELPLPLDPSWVTELRLFTFRQTPRTQRNDIIHYTSKAIELANQNPGDFVLKYAVARLRGVTIQQGNWDLVQQFLLQCLMVEPGTFLPVLERLMHAHQNQYPIDVPSIEQVMNRQVVCHAPAGRASEVSWALWALIYWNVPLSRAAAEALSQMEDSVVALLALDAQSRGLAPAGLDTSLWESFMTQDDLYDRQWLLAYEANVKGWLPSVGQVDHVANDAAFAFLRDQGVEFYDSQRLVTYRPAAARAAGVRAPLFSYIEP